MDDNTQSPETESQNPFSMEAAYKTYQENIRKAGQLVYDLTKGARGDVSEHDLLLMAVEVIARMTDNTALYPVISKALEERASRAGEEAK